MLNRQLANPSEHGQTDLQIVRVDVHSLHCYRRLGVITRLTRPTRGVREAKPCTGPSLN